MKDKNHGDGQKPDDEENAVIEIVMWVMTTLTIIAIVLEIVTWFVR